MTILSFDENGCDVVYDGIEFRLEKSLIEEATGKRYVAVTDHEVARMVEKDADPSGPARVIADILE